MLRVLPWVCTLEIVMATCLLIGCMSTTTFQPPRVLDPGEKAVGVGFGESLKPISGVGGLSDISGAPYVDLFDRYSPTDITDAVHIDVFARFGVAEDIDIGVKLLPFGGLCDVEYQMIENPLLVAGDFGVSYTYTPVSGAGYRSIAGVYPMLLAGKRNYHAGLKLVYVYVTYLEGGGRVHESRSYALPVVLIGASFGHETKILPELSLYFVRRSYGGSHRTGWRIFPIVGFGLQWRFD